MEALVTARAHGTKVELGIKFAAATAAAAAAAAASACR